MPVDIEKLRDLARARRVEALTLCYRSKGGHIGGVLSSMDLLCALYYRVLRVSPKTASDPGRDRFLLSKGHSVEGLWAILADRGFFPSIWLESYGKPGSPLMGHPSNKLPGVEMCTGALGHGLSIGVGAALAAKRMGADYRTYVVMGDGEQAEGSVWEAAMAGANYGLDNLTAIVDRNGLQISGSTESVMRLEDFAAKWRAFGWAVEELDGNDMTSVVAALEAAPTPGQPRLLIAHTVKGKGVSFMENQAGWHHGVLSDEQYKQALSELGQTEEVRFL